MQKPTNHDAKEKKKSKKTKKEKYSNSNEKRRTIYWILRIGLGKKRRKKKGKAIYTLDFFFARIIFTYYFSLFFLLQPHSSA